MPIRGRDTSSYEEQMEEIIIMKTFDTTQSSVKKLYRAMTNPIRLMPDFIIIGTQRGGTTSLYNYLTEHPNIASASTKEVHFFDKNFAKGLTWYRAQFPSTVQKYYVERIRKQDFITGEASPYYLLHPHVPKRVAAIMPHVKLIILLRNPVDRAYSQYYHEVELGHETLSFEEAIQREEERTGKEAEKLAQNEHYSSYNHQHYTYLARGIYVDQLHTWMNLFPKEQFLILKSEDFYADPGTTFKQTLEFLKLPCSAHKERKKEYKQYNNNTYSKMVAATRKRLIEYFEPHNARLYEYLGVNFGWDK